MKNSEKKWLEPASWENVLNLYQTHCQGQKVDPLLSKASFDKTRQYWESQVGKSMSLPQALEVCQKCYQMSPFVFNNGNVFATFAKQLVDGWAKSLPAVEGQMLLTTVGHFVTGKVPRKELMQILSFLAPSWQKYQAASTVVVRPQPQAAPTAEVAPALAPERELIAS